MKKIKTMVVSLSFLLAFMLWTMLLVTVDVKNIGPNNSSVGLATLNGYVHNLTSENLALYLITDWLGLVPIAFSCVFAFLGLVQWIKRKKLLKVDKDILLLGLFYVIVFSLYVMFEYVVINYRPILINGILE
ncbi:MAG: phosphoesterase PA-phosphatase, partial [Clostridia bacterium]|nr:phosphoesterase PA-phosphatase [Clostridia bacterium]